MLSVTGAERGRQEDGKNRVHGGPFLGFRQHEVTGSKLTDPELGRFYSNPAERAHGSECDSRIRRRAPTDT
ncbi:MAG: hypothetical protein AB7H71_05595, partial [Alphaproteobacteria bacterium]